MTYFVNIIDDIASSNALFTILVVALIVVFLATLYLMNVQSKANVKNIMNQKSGPLNRNDMIGEVLFKDNINSVHPIDKIKEQENQEGSIDTFEDSRDSIIHSEGLSFESLEDEIPYFLKESEFFKKDSESVEDNSSSEDYSRPIESKSVFDKEEIHKDPYKEKMLDNYLSNVSAKASYAVNVKNEEENITKDDDSFNLLEVTRELEAIPRERTIDLTDYEAEQEEKAIISYDELIQNIERNNIDYYEAKDEFDAKYSIEEIEAQNAKANNQRVSIDNHEENVKENVVREIIKEDEFSLVEPIKEEYSDDTLNTTYEHEEAFLETLKQLQQILN